MIWGNRKAEYFCAEGSTETMRDLPVGQHKGLGVEGRAGDDFVSSFRSANPESRTSLMRNCASEVWSFGLSRNDGINEVRAQGRIPE